MGLSQKLGVAFLSAGLALTPIASTAQDMRGAMQYMEDFNAAKALEEEQEYILAQARLNEPTEFIQYHAQMRDDAGIYARDLYMGHILTPSGSINTMAQRGLTNLALQSHLRTSVEPAGVVGIDLTNAAHLENLSLIPVLYFPVTKQTERLSDDARHALQDYIRNGGFIAIDVVSGGHVNNSPALRGLLDDLQIRPPQRLEEGHSLTQSFYLLSALPGSAGNASVWVESAPANLGEAGVSSVVISDQNWAGAWAGVTTDLEGSESAFRSGLNILMYALSGHYKSDPIHDETLDQKREYLRQDALRAAEQAAPSAE